MIIPRFRSVFDSSEDGVLADSTELVNTIERGMGGMRKHSFWTVGTTSDPDVREEVCGFPGFWRFWEASSPAVAAEARDALVKKGMKDDPNREAEANFIYIY